MSVDTQPLHGKFALVTGASRGIGRGIALRLAERGAAVAVNFLQNEPAALDTVARIKSGGGEAFAVQGNVAHPDELAAMVRNVKERFGALDIFVHNALGDLLGFMSPPLQVTLEQWNAALECQQQAFLVGVHSRAAFARQGTHYRHELLAWKSPGRLPALLRDGNKQGSHRGNVPLLRRRIGAS
jgi:NAD(P)-dependent dehydrogenase (short-subunit alcohol dehydrogenase family)